MGNAPSKSEDVVETLIVRFEKDNQVFEGEN